MLHGNSLDTLFVIKDTQSLRVSSAAADGSNEDYIVLQPGEVRAFAEMEGAGIVRHIWCTFSSHAPDALTRLALRMYWDGEDHPSVEAPLGDFFGIGMGVCKNFTSEPLQMCPQDGRGFNCFFPMPFGRGARMTLTNETEEPANFYFYVDYERLEEVPDEYARFHAQWRRVRDTDGLCRYHPELMEELSPKAGNERPEWWKKAWDLANLTGEKNYTILEARGRGHYVGCNLNVVNFDKQVNDWYGEGDDMIFIDDDALPTLSGTGTEDYFNTAYCPQQEYSAPYSGLTVYSGDEHGRPWAGKNSLYRFHIKDPIRFKKSIRVTIETGHANKLANDYSSTAYWYQQEPHCPDYSMPGEAERRPRSEIR